MRNKLYLECTSGISGDMTVAALLDLGADQKKLVRTLKSLPVKGFDIKMSIPSLTLSFSGLLSVFAVCIIIGIFA